MEWVTWKICVLAASLALNVYLIAALARSFYLTVRK